MFPRRKVNALTPIFASLDREKEDLSLPPKIPLRYVRNSLQFLQTYSNNLFDQSKFAKIVTNVLQLYSKKKITEKKSTKKKLNFQSEKEDVQSATDFEQYISNLQSETYSPFSRFTSNSLEEQLETILSPFFVEHLVYGQIIQKIADTYQVIIGLKKPTKIGQSLAFNKYKTARFEHALTFSDLGPTAGFIPHKGIYCSGNLMEQQKHQASIKNFMENNVELIDLSLSESLILDSIRYRNLKKIHGDIYSAIYYGQVFYFEISPSNFKVFDITNNEIVKVLANKKEATPIIENYHISFLAIKKDTPIEILVHKKILIEKIMNALNNLVKDQNLFIYNDDLNKLGSQREYIFFPFNQSKQLINKQNKQILFSKLMENAYQIMSK